ncbi:MAG: chorismate mutase [archaeon]|nr:chorismate mutase [archaeon]
MGEKILFDNDQEAKDLLLKSRKEIDEIDNKLIDLISLRTSLAKDILHVKLHLGMEIYDKTREESIHKKITILAEEKDLDPEILNQIMDMLTILNKNKQKEHLKEEC